MNQQEIDQLFDQEQIFRFLITNVESITFDRREMEKVCTKQRLNVKRLQISISTEGMKFFSLLNWTNLSHISFVSSQFGNISCKFLSRAALKNIKQILLDWNQIGDDGLKHLSKAPWKSLHNLSLTHNYLKSNCVGWIIRANWPNISILDARSSIFRAEELIQFILMQFRSMKSFHFESQNITGRQNQALTLLKNKLSLRIKL